MKQQLMDLPPVMRLRTRIGQHILDRERHHLQRDTRSLAFDDARRIGVLFTGEDEATLRDISNFCRLLREKGKTVRVMGYVPRPRVAETLSMASDLEFFSQEDLNWYFRPESRHVVSFIEEPFDILIDLRLQRRMPVPYMVAMSRARFKVGRYREGNDGLHDLMIHAEEGMGLADFGAQVLRYLEMIDPNATDSGRS